ncbi:Phosphatase IMPL1, chloroplastic, partial [Mucuna pruriens]
MPIVFSAAANLSPLFSKSPGSLSSPLHSYPTKFHRNGWHAIHSKSRMQPRITNSLLSDKYPTVGARSTGSIPPTHLIEVVTNAAQTGAQPSNLTTSCKNTAATSTAVKGWPTIKINHHHDSILPFSFRQPINEVHGYVSPYLSRNRTDKMSEAAILEVVKKNFKDHLVLGEEGGIIGDAASDYLWCIDPLDGTTNFAHGYPSFAVSIGVLYRGNPAAAAVLMRD